MEILCREETPEYDVDGNRVGELVRTTRWHRVPEAVRRATDEGITRTGVGVASDDGESYRILEGNAQVETWGVADEHRLAFVHDDEPSSPALGAETSEVQETWLWFAIPADPESTSTGDWVSFGGTGMADPLASFQRASEETRTNILDTSGRLLGEILTKAEHVATGTSADAAWVVTETTSYGPVSWLATSSTPRSGRRSSRRLAWAIFDSDRSSNPLRRSPSSRSRRCPRWPTRSSCEGYSACPGVRRDGVQVRRRRDRRREPARPGHGRRRDVGAHHGGDVARRGGSRGTTAHPGAVRGPPRGPGLAGARAVRFSAARRGVDRGPSGRRARPTAGRRAHRLDDGADPFPGPGGRRRPGDRDPRPRAVERVGHPLQHAPAGHRSGVQSSPPGTRRGPWHPDPPPGPGEDLPGRRRRGHRRRVRHGERRGVASVGARRRIAQDAVVHVLDQSAANGALQPGESYIGLVMHDGSPGVGKSLGAVAPVPPVLQAHEVALARVTVTYQAGGVSVINPADVADARVFGRHKVVAGAGTTVEVHPGEMIARPTWRFSSVVQPVPVPVSATSWLWLMADGRPSTTSTAAPPSDAAELLAEVDTDATSITEIRDVRTLVSGAGVQVPAPPPPPPAPAFLFETATLGPIGQDGTSGFVLNANIWVGAKFSIASPTSVDALGIHVVGGADPDLFAGIVALDPGTGFPPVPFNEGDFLVSGNLAAATSSEVTMSFPGAVLAAGDYGVVFGSGAFGATGTGATPGNDLNVGAPDYFNTTTAGASWVDGGFSFVRMFARGA